MECWGQYFEMITKRLTV